MKGPKKESRSSLRKEVEAFLDTLRAGTPPTGETDGGSCGLLTDPEAVLRRADGIVADETARFLKFRAACRKGGRL